MNLLSWSIGAIDVPPQGIPQLRDGDGEELDADVPQPVMKSPTNRRNKRRPTTVEAYVPVCFVLVSRLPLYGVFRSLLTNIWLDYISPLLRVHLTLSFNLVRSLVYFLCVCSFSHMKVDFNRLTPSSYFLP